VATNESESGIGALPLQYGVAERMWRLGFGERLARDVGSGKKRRSVKLAPYGSESGKSLL
jgi:hypothetical protein